MTDAVRLRRQAEDLADRFPALIVAAERVAMTVAQGVHGRRRVGLGDAFWQFRQYEPGDQVNRIDWRQTAKRDRVFVRETEWEASESIWLWRDVSASMRWRSRPSLPQKAERADLITLALMALLIRGGERVALLGENLRPSSGRNSLGRFALTIARGGGRDADSGLPPPVDLPRHAQVVLIGDFLSPLPAVDVAVRAIAARGIKGHIVHLYDPAEESLPFEGRTRFEGLENDGELLIQRVESVRTQYGRVFADHHAGLADIARAVGWNFLTHVTERPPESALLTLYQALAGPRNMA